MREFAHSPARPQSPNGQRVVWDLMSIFRFDDQGWLVEEWVRTDYRSFLLNSSHAHVVARAKCYRSGDEHDVLVPSVLLSTQTHRRRLRRCVPLRMGRDALGQ